MDKYNKIQKKFSEVCNDIKDYKDNIERLLELNEKNERKYVNNRNIPLYKENKDEIEELLDEERKSLYFAEIDKKYYEDSLIRYNPLKNYEINNGLLGMKRDTNIRLSYFLDDNKLRQLFGVAGGKADNVLDQNYFAWKEHFWFKRIHEEKLKFTMNDILRIRPHIFRKNGPNPRLIIEKIINDYSGTYRLQIKILHPQTDFTLTFVNTDKSDDDIIISKKLYRTNLKAGIMPTINFKEGDIVSVLIDTEYGNKNISFYINDKKYMDADFMATLPFKVNIIPQNDFPFQILNLNLILIKNKLILF
jgi:hypothetical protein